MPPNTSRDAILSRPLSEPEPVISEPYDDEAMAREMRQHQLRMVYMMTGGLVAAMVIGVGLRKWLKK